ncbi:MAG TPA: hypothetical protein VHV32_19090 [Candidatus Angelobacter sp.]|jgi:hypothetical protein|nr:hypothetical protein [Candidatus Angelobacter sp.]
MAAVFKLHYTEADYALYLQLRDSTPWKQLDAWFGRHRVEQMERRWQSERCSSCGDEVTEEEAADADNPLEPVCFACQRAGKAGRDNPDADNDTPRSEW